MTQVLTRHGLIAVIRAKGAVPVSGDERALRTQLRAIYRATGPVTAAATYNANVHPKGKDGRFITTGGTVQVTNNQGQPIAEGVVQKINPDGSIQIRNGQTHQIQTVPATSVKQAPNVTAHISATVTATNQQIPLNPKDARAQAVLDAQHGKPMRVGDAVSATQATPASIILAYQNAYKQEANKLARAKAAATKKAAAAKKKAAKKGAGGGGGGGGPQKPPNDAALAKGSMSKISKSSGHFYGAWYGP